jgi:hypothetical protein
MDIDYDIDIDKHLSSIGYKICLTPILFDQLFKLKVRNICYQKCAECYDFKIEMNIESKQNSDPSVTLKIFEIIADNSPHVKYIETLKTDLNQLMYNLGGIISLSFGLSPKQIPGLLKILKHLSKALMNSLHKLLLHFLNFFSIISGIIFRYLVLYSLQFFHFAFLILSLCAKSLILFIFLVVKKLISFVFFHCKT